MCVGGGCSHFKIKGCGGNACPPTLILACVLPTVTCSLDCLTKSNPDGIFLILNANSVRNSLEANSEFRCKCIPNSSVATPRVHHRQGHRQQRGKHPFYSAPRSTEIICAAHRLSRPAIIGRHLRASNEMIHGHFGIMILMLRL